MSWLFSQALVAEYSAATSWDGAPSAPLSVMPTQHKFSRNDKTMESSQLSRFGLTCAVLTENRGEALLTWFRADSRVRTFPLLAQVPALAASAQASGQSSHESLTKYDPASSSWKTAQLSLLEGSDEFSETWPRWGSMRSGECWEQTTLAPLTSEKESGLLPTPSATEGGPMPELSHEPRMNQRNYSKKTGRHCQVTLRRYVETWPTPVASMSKGSSPASLTRKSGSDRSNDRLDHAVMASDGGQLNPTWVEWLMGWPIGWTDLKPLEMAKFHEWQRQHSRCSAKNEDAA